MKLTLEAYLQRNKTGQFFRVQNYKNDWHDLSFDSTKTALFEFQITLDSEEKHHSAKIYGVIDAIGTLGGVHEITLWCIILIYGSVRKNMYLFSIINSLIQSEQFQDIHHEIDEQRDINLNIRSHPIETSRQSRVKFNNNQTHNYTSVQLSEIKKRPRIFQK